MNNIQYKGINDLNEEEKNKLIEISEKHFERIMREVKNINSSIVHIKTDSKGGKRKRYDIIVKVFSPRHVFESQDSDWDFTKTLHKVFINIEKEMKHELRLE